MRLHPYGTSAADYYVPMTHSNWKHQHGSLELARVFSSKISRSCLRMPRCQPYSSQVEFSLKLVDGPLICEYVGWKFARNLSMAMLQGMAGGMLLWIRLERRMFSVMLRKYMRIQATSALERGLSTACV